MANTSIDILGSFKLNQWYKLAIYLGAIVIVLRFVFANSLDVASYTSFAVESLVLGLVVWVLDDTLVAYWKIQEKENSHREWEIAKAFTTGIFILRWVGLFLWVLIILANI